MGMAAPEVWRDAVTEAKDKEFHGKYDIWGGDIDPACIDIARANAKRAGVSEHIRFQVADALKFSRDTSGGIIICNPPYGERVMQHAEAEKNLPRFRLRCKAFRQLENVHTLITH